MVYSVRNNNPISLILNGRVIGPSQPPFIIAEMSGNHNGDFNQALRLIEEAKKAGADAVKLQTYTADTLTINHDGPDFIIIEGPWKGYSLYQLYEWAHTPWEWHEALFAKGKELGLTVFSSPFDYTAVEFLESLDCPAYKIASFEAIDLALINKAASTGKPLFISTGLASFEEIGEAVNAAREAGCNKLVLMHCVSAYPAPPEDYDIRVIPDLSHQYNVVTGISDHTTGIAVSIASIALGSAVIEKHFTLKRSDGGPDATFSLEPHELAALCNDCRIAWESLGTINYSRKPSEAASVVFRRSLYVVEDMDLGDEFTGRNLRSIRPGYGLPPKHLNEILGRRANQHIKRGTPLDWSMVATVKK